MTVEREVKLPASPSFRMPALDGIADGVRVVGRDDEILHTVYYDASDLRLLRAGASLRYRGGHSWTVKLPVDERGPVLAREEVEFPDDGAVVPAHALRLVRAYLRTADVVPVLRLRTVRRRLDLVGAGEAPLVEVVDDEVDVVSGTLARVRFRELEVERRADDAGRLVDGVVRRLRRAGAGEPDPLPKPVRALGAIAAAPPDVVVGNLGDDPTAGEVVRAAIAASVLRLIRHDPVIRLGVDEEGVHQARVATRRLRSDLRTFGPLLDDGWTGSVRDELRWLADALGAARDADVLLGRTRGRGSTLGVVDRPGAAAIIGALEQRAKDAHVALLDAIDGPRYAILLDTLVEAANGPPLSDAASAPAGDVLPPLVRRPWTELRERARTATREPSAEALHAVRIRTKRLRYAADAVEPAVGTPARRLADAAEELQDVLGEHHDAVVAAGWLRAFAVDRPAGEAFVAGLLAGREEAASEDARARWRRTWRRLDRRKLRSWM